MKASNMPETLKSQRLQDAQAHLDLARVQRKHYNDQCATAKGNMAESSSQPTVMHYSFDYAQQVHFPFNAQQPGPIFFKTPRKCGVFGVCCEPTSTQLNYLIDEADDVGKGANATISLVHHFLQNHGLMEKHLKLHADKCVGQNKNNMVIQYLVWRVKPDRVCHLVLTAELWRHEGPWPEFRKIGRNFIYFRTLTIFLCETQP